MRVVRRASLVVAVVLALGGCAAQPAPADPSPSSSPAPSVSASPEVKPESIVITSAGIRVVGTDGSTLLEVGQESNEPAVFAGLAEVLGIEVSGVVVPTPAPLCFDDTTEYDFGGFVLTVPGQYPAHIAGAFQAHVQRAATTGGIPLVSIGGVHVGSTEAEFTAAVGPTVPLFSYNGMTAVGFDLLGEDVGSQASFENGVITDLWMSRVLGSDC